jgi:hypothetical protein
LTGSRGPSEVDITYFLLELEIGDPDLGTAGWLLESEIDIIHVIYLDAQVREVG